MASSHEFTEAIVNQAMNAPKVISEPIEWKTKNNGVFCFFKVALEGINRPLPYETLLHGNYNLELGTYTFTIIMNGNRVKSLDIGKAHKEHGEKHKHSWTETHKDRNVYVPDDITTGADMKIVFQEFLAECNIKTEVELPNPPSSQAGFSI